MSETRLPEADDFPIAGPNSIAPFGQRAYARVFDELLTGVPFIALAYLLLPDVMNFDTSSGQTPPPFPLWFILASTVVGIGYEVVLIAWRGQTLGKWLLHIRVARFTDGAKPTWGQSALRCLLPSAISIVLDEIGIPSPLVAVFYLSVFLNPLMRGWHDLAGGTVVVRTR